MKRYLEVRLSLAYEDNDASEILIVVGSPNDHACTVVLTDPVMVEKVYGLELVDYTLEPIRGGRDEIETRAAREGRSLPEVIRP